MISVLTPSFNSGKYIERAIQSVCIQDYTNWEHIVVDGGSTDYTLSILKKHKHLKWISEPDSGQSDAMNKAFLLSSGNLIVYLNADDEIAPNIFSFVVNYFSINPRSKFLVGNLLKKRPERNQIQTPSTDLLEIINYSGYKFPLNPVSYYYKREVQEKIGLFPESNHLTMDYWFLLRAYKYFSIKKCDRVFGSFYYYPEAKSMKDNGKPSRASLKEVAEKFQKENRNYLRLLMLWRRIINRFNKMKLSSRET